MGLSHGTDAVIIIDGVLYGINLNTASAKELVPIDGAGQQTEAVWFTRNGQGLLLQRDWVGQDSWWAVNPDGSGLKRLPIVGEKQTGPVTSLGEAGFVGCFRGDQLVRFDLTGQEPDYHQLQPDEHCFRDGQMTTSPDGNKFAYTAASGIVVTQVANDSMRAVYRIPGKHLVGWLSSDILVATDEDNLYLLHVATGKTSQVEVGSLSPSARSVSSVVLNPAGKILYVTVQRSNGTAETLALAADTLTPLSGYPDKRPEDALDPVRFSSGGHLAVWGLPGTRGIPVAVARLDTGAAILKTNETTGPLPYVLHPNKAALLYGGPAQAAGYYDLRYMEADGRESPSGSGRPRAEFSK